MQQIPSIRSTKRNEEESRADKDEGRRKEYIFEGKRFVFEDNPFEMNYFTPRIKTSTYLRQVLMKKKNTFSPSLSLLCSTIDNLVSPSNRNYEQSFLFFPPKKVGSSIEGIDREAKPPYIKLSFRHSPYNPEAGKPPLVRPRHCRCWPSFVTRLPPSLPSPTNNSPSYGSSPPRFGFSSEVELRGSSDCVHPCGTSNSSN